MTRKGILMKFFSGMILALFALALNAQPTLTDVINAFNAGAEEVNSGNFDTAIVKFEETIALADQLGAEGDEMKANAKAQIPALHYRMALDAYKEKDIAGAIAKFEKTVEACDQYGNDDIREKSLKYIPQLYYALGNTQVKDEELDAALASFNKAIEYQPDYARAIYGKALVYKKQNDDAMMIATMEEAIKVGTSSGDDKTTEAATKTLKDHFMNAGKLAFKDEEFDKAIQNFEASNKYNSQDPESYYLTCVIYGKQGDFDKAVEYGLKAVQYEKADDQAKIWYEIGNAYMGLVEYDKACEAFKKALVEPYLTAVKYKMENVLNCK
jgi:tetratricopeptide (TPR) repeat protein